MTWFEAEQIDKYLEKLERMLDEWRLEPVQMRMENAELSRARRKIETVKTNTPNPQMRHYLADLHKRIEDCSGQIQERLKR